MRVLEIALYRDPLGRGFPLNLRWKGLSGPCRECVCLKVAYVRDRRGGIEGVGNLSASSPSFVRRAPPSREVGTILRPALLPNPLTAIGAISYSRRHR